MNSLPPTSGVPPRSHRIRAVSVIGGFLDGLRLELADGLNCLIGGRGTGKTTVLEFVRFALDALPDRNDDPEERRRIETLVEKNLGGGRVQVEFQTKAGLAYRVSRSWGEEPVVVTADGQPTQLTLKSGAVFRADLFSQNEIERIADRTPSQLVLVDRFEADVVAEIDSQLRSMKQDLAANANKLLALGARQVELQEEIATLPEVEEKLKAFADHGGEDADMINEAHGHKALRDQECGTLRAIEDDLSQGQAALRTQAGRLAERTAVHLTEEMLSGPNSAVFAELATQLKDCGDAVDTLLRQAEDRLGKKKGTSLIIDGEGEV